MLLTPKFIYFVGEVGDNNLIIPNIFDTSATEFCKGGICNLLGGYWLSLHFVFSFCEIVPVASFHFKFFSFL